jgi:GTP cyclohydrolase II
MKHNYTAMLTRFLGIKLAWHVRYIADAATFLQNAIDERINDPKRVERKMQDLAQENAERIREANAASSHAAADEGRTIFEWKRLHGGRAGWIAFLRGRGYSRSTAYNRMALYLLRRNKPDLFARYAVLGKTKCARMATASGEILANLTAQSFVRLPSGKETALEYLTDAELIEHLKGINPMKRRPRHQVLHQALRAAERATSDAKYTSEPLTPQDLEATRDAAQRVVNRLNELLRAG